MQKLAKEFGLSDVGLAKLCRRHRIPLSGRGYWARIQFGQKPHRIALPALTELWFDVIKFSPRDPRSRKDMLLEEGEAIPRIYVADDRPISHRIALRIERSMSRKTMDDRGILATRQGRILPFKLTVGALPRALRMIDAFFSALGDAKYALWPSRLESSRWSKSQRATRSLSKPTAR
jgi:hypothetical protein